jgi:hypothetical protein
MAGAKPRNSCISLFKKPQFFALAHEYLLSLMNFTVNDLEKFHANSTVHGIITQN